MPQAKYKLPEIDKTRIYFVDKKGAPQSEIRVGNLSLAMMQPKSFLNQTS
ncbi:MAG: hypothetical protein IPH32_09970 [Bacteroidetes bacterium]|nr:hypothetical protein [Bacteroidota bacterium]